MKKHIQLLTVLIVFVCSSVHAQKTIQAEDIIRDIKAGKYISLSNATIEGKLDFTDMNEKLKDLPKRKRKWWKTGNVDNKVSNSISVKLTFINCKFKDDVLAYIPDSDDSGYTFTADFENVVIFENCVFERKAMFKYSTFKKYTSFEKTDFRDDTTFKYAKFPNKSAIFKGSKWENGASFKYAKFGDFVSFENAFFNESATFKYSKFEFGVSFKDAQFEEDLNMKYAEVRGGFNISGMKVAFELDSKYTKINGKSFSKYLIEN